MTIEEGAFHPPQERPSIIARDYIVALLAQVISKKVPTDLLPAILDFLEAQGVVARDGDSYSIPGSPDALAVVPRQAVESLRGAIDKHSQSSKHSTILRSILLARPAGGSGGLSQSGPGPRVNFHARSARDLDTEIEELRWERESYLRHFASMGEDNARRLFDIVVRLMVPEPPAIPKPIDSVKREGLQGDLFMRTSHGFTTAFEVFRHWCTSLDKWREYVIAPNVRPSPELLLTLPTQATADSPSTGMTFQLVPPPAARIVEGILQQPSFSAFVSACVELADAADQVVLVLFRHGLPTAEAKALAARLRSRNYLPTLADNDSTWVVQRQLEEVDAGIWRGVLPLEEDILERRAFWQHRVLGMKTPEGRAKLEAAVTDLLRSPRNPDREIAMLNAVCRLERHEELTLQFARIPPNKGPDAADVSRRWRALIDFGFQHFAIHGIVNFSDAARAESLYGNKDSPSSLDLLWARATKEATQALFPLARAAQFDPAGTKPLHVLIRDMDSALSGKKIDLHQPVADVELIVAEIESQQRSTPAPADDHPPQRSPTTSDLTHHADQFEQFATEFHAFRTGLRDNASNLQLIAETRVLLASAGAALVDLIRRHAIEAPSPAPPWLAWLTSGANLKFGQLTYGVTFSGGDGTFACMLNHVAVAASLDKQALRCLDYPDNRSLHNRHIFLEAVGTWLGSQCTPPVQLRLPMGSVEVDGTDVRFVVDWAGGIADQTNLLLLNIGRAAEAVCDYVARMLRQSACVVAPANPIRPTRTVSPPPHVDPQPAPEPPLSTSPPDVAAANTKPAATIPEVVVNMLIREGKTWRMRFAGKECPLPDRVGFKYLQKLLANPNVEIGAADLKGVSVAKESAQEVLDRKAIESMRKVYKDAQDDLEEGHRSGDIAKQEDAKRRIEELSEFVTQISARQKSRAMTSNIERIRVANAGAIERAMEEIKTVHPEAHAHLEESLVGPSSYAPAYKPGSATIWQVNPPTDSRNPAQASDKM